MHPFKGGVLFELMCPVCGKPVATMNVALWGLIWSVKCNACCSKIAAYDILTANEHVVKQYLSEFFIFPDMPHLTDVDDYYRLMLEGANREI